MKKFLVVLCAVLLVQAALAGKKKKDSSDSDSNSSEKKSSKNSKNTCPACPPRQILVIREVTVCELDLKRLTCPAGSTIRIHEAFYGRRNSYTCRYQNNPTDSTDVCSTPRALEIVSNRCNGRQDCDVSAANQWLTDPCRATYKYLEVSFSCSTPQYANNQNNNRDNESSNKKNRKHKNRS